MGVKISKKSVLGLSIVIILTVFVALVVFRETLKERVINTVFSRITGGAVKVGGDGENLSLQGSQGDYSFDQGKVPDNFPKDFPIYPNAKFNGSWTAKGDTGVGISVIWETEDSISDVKTYYLSEFPRVGWKVTSSFNSDNSSTISFEKDDKSGFLGITRAEALTTISISVGMK
jgi:hypothetical protein